MNERIKDLYKQSANQDYFPIDSEEVYMSAKDLKKFAELIVRECANMLDEDSYLMPELGGYAHDMRQRFGVKDV
jgi:hypothetical protein